MKNESWKIFDRIYPKYDRINRILSFGNDVRWRKKLAKHTFDRPFSLLDLATGTADQIIYLFEEDRPIKEAVGIDLSNQMLKLAKEKISTKSYMDKVRLLEADACHLPFKDGQFDCTCMSFGIRNVPDPLVCASEMYRVLKKGGRALILEFSLPSSKLMKPFHLFYLRKILPRIGNFLSKDKTAYTYLNQTIESFPYGKEFCKLLEKASFQNVQAKAFTFGAVTLYIAEKC